jgi:hypothetical protein
MSVAVRTSHLVRGAGHRVKTVFPKSRIERESAIQGVSKRALQP